MKSSNKLQIQTTIIKENKSVKELLADLKLEKRYFAVLIDGKTANMDDIITKDQKVIILPKLMGG